ncbi:metalloprotease 1 precursor, partial [Aphelenchoides avenae]
MPATKCLRVVSALPLLVVVACQVSAGAANESDLAKQRQQFLKDIVHEFPPEIVNPILEKARKLRRPTRPEVKSLPADVVERLKTLEKEPEQDKNVEETVESIPQINRAFSDLLFEGDIVLPTPPQNVSKDRRGKRQIVTGQNYPRNKWTPGVPIAYRFDSSIDSFAQNIIRIGVKFWQENTCLSFEENGRNRPIIRFFKGQGCYSLAGKAFYQSEQDVSIGDGCETFGNVAHEVAHALGVLHHHNRPDRDDYITVQSQNVAPGWER